VVIVAAGLRLGISPEALTVGLGLASGAAILGLITVFAARRWGWRDPLIWLAPGALALSRTFTAWCSGGLETQFFSLLVLLGLLCLLRERERGVGQPWVSSFVLGVATLTRPEGGLFALAAGLCLLGEVARRRRGLRALVVWTLPFVAVVGAHWLWRRGYYGFWLPNTFTAKVNGFWWEQGRRYLALFLSETPLHAFAPLMLLSIARRRDFASALFGISAALTLAYLAAIGGGHIGFRFLVPVLPILSWLIADGVHVLVEIRAAKPGRRWALAGAATALAATLLATTHWGSLHPAPRENSNGIGTTADADGYAELRIAQGLALRALVDRGLLPADLRIETGAAGALPYYTDWYVLDKRGLNDLRVARQPLAQRGRIAHEHTAPLSYVLEREVAVVLLGHKLLVEVAEQDLPLELRGARAWLRLYNRAARSPGERLRLQCRRVEEGAYLVFGTNLEANRLERVLGHLERCPGFPGAAAAESAKMPRSALHQELGDLVVAGGRQVDAVAAEVLVAHGPSRQRVEVGSQIAEHRVLRLRHLAHDLDVAPVQRDQLGEVGGLAPGFVRGGRREQHRDDVAAAGQDDHLGQVGAEILGCHALGPGREVSRAQRESRLL
jgi:arabinofuranosyltransferase